MEDLELFLVGLVMAATVYSVGDPFEDPVDDFGLWVRSWDAVRPAWSRMAEARGWHVVGRPWGFHQVGRF